MFATGRVAIAAQAPTPTLPVSAIRTEAGQSYVWAIDSGKLVRRNVMLGRRDENAGRVELKTALPADLPILGSKFDNLKEGAPALVKAESVDVRRSPPEAPGSAPSVNAQA